MERLASASLGEVLEKVQAAIAAGSVNVISIEAIRERSGDRWLRKREQVEAFVERTFARLSQPGDLMVSLNDAEFITVQPSVSCTTAVSVSANVLKDTLAFFLGKAAREDLRLFRVTSFNGGALGLEPVAAAAIDQLFHDELPASGQQPDADLLRGSALSRPPAGDLHWALTRRVRLISPPDLEIDLAISPEPAWNVAAKVVASFYLRQTTGLAAGGASSPVGNLSPSMAGEAALASLAYAEELIAKRGLQVALHVPVALAAVTYSVSRFRILNALRELPPPVRRFLVLELSDVSEGLPQSRLTEMSAMLRPHCRALLARAPSETTDIRQWRGCGLSGVALECGHLDPGDKGAQLRLGAFAQSAAEGSLSCVAYNLPSRSLMLAAWASGFTHVGGPILSAEVGSPDAVVRLAPSDLFSKVATA